MNGLMTDRAGRVRVSDASAARPGRASALGVSATTTLTSATATRSVRGRMGMSMDERERELRFIGRQVRGALRDTINKHGPITLEHVGSAVKRVSAQVLAAQEDRARREKGAGAE